MFSPRSRWRYIDSTEFGTKGCVAVFISSRYQNYLSIRHLRKIRSWHLRNDRTFSSILKFLSWGFFWHDYYLSILFAFHESFSAYLPFHVRFSHQQKRAKDVPPVKRKLSVHGAEFTLLRFTSAGKWEKKAHLITKMAEEFMWVITHCVINPVGERKLIKILGVCCWILYPV